MVPEKEDDRPDVMYYINGVKEMTAGKNEQRKTGKKLRMMTKVLRKEIALITLNVMGLLRG